jgi:hypothetical protein
MPSSIIAIFLIPPIFSHSSLTRVIKNFFLNDCISSLSPWPRAENLPNWNLPALAKEFIVFCLSEISVCFPDLVTDLRTCHFCLYRSGKLGPIRARHRFFWRFSEAQISLCAVYFRQAGHGSKSLVILLGTARHGHQFVQSRHRFLRFPRRSANRRFRMLGRRSHNCEFWEFSAAYLQTELICLWRQLNLKIEMKKKIRDCNFRRIFELWRSDNR